MRRMMGSALLAAVLSVAAFAVVAQGKSFTDWQAAKKLDEVGGNNSELNTTSLDGCPIQAPDGRSLFMASNRPGGKGLLDIWVARRQRAQDPWGAPQNLGEPVNSAADDFCPTPIKGDGLFFVSREVLPGACGAGDIYFTRRSRQGGWTEPVHLGCAPDGPNSPLDEQGPSYVESGKRGALYFSRSSPTVSGEIYVAGGLAGQDFGRAAPVGSLNDAAANDIQPNVRSDRLEVVFSSNRSGTFGGQDIWVATREKTDDPWGSPVNLGPAVNSAASESRPSLSGHARTLLFGRAPGPEGSSDIYVTSRRPGRR
jgi:hypothetical protein